MDWMSLTRLAPPVPVPGMTASMQLPMHDEVVDTAAAEPMHGSIHVMPATYVTVDAAAAVLIPGGSSGVRSAERTDSGRVTDWPNELSVMPPVGDCGLLAILT